MFVEEVLGHVEHHGVPANSPLLLRVQVSQGGEHTDHVQLVLPNYVRHLARRSGGQVVRWSGGQVVRWSGGQVIL